MNRFETGIGSNKNKVEPVRSCTLISGVLLSTISLRTVRSNFMVRAVEFEVWCAVRRPSFSQTLKPTIQTFAQFTRSYVLSYVRLEVEQTSTYICIHASLSKVQMTLIAS